jgi:hypothetical protein
MSIEYPIALRLYDVPSPSTLLLLRMLDHVPSLFLLLKMRGHPRLHPVVSTASLYGQRTEQWRFECLLINRKSYIAEFSYLITLIEGNWDRDGRLDVVIVSRIHDGNEGSSQHQS